MVSLTNEQFGLLQLSIEALQQEIARLRLNLIVEADFDRLVAVLKAGQVGVLNPTFDPHLNPPGPDDFWLHVTDIDGQTAACIASRFFETDDFTDLVQSGTLFHPKGMKHFVGDETVEIIETTARIRGLVNYAGGLWVNPPWRKKGLSLILPYLGRSLAIRNFGADYSCGYHLRSLARTPLPLEVYGYAHQELSYRGYYPPAGGYEEMYLGYVDLEESVERVRGLPDHKVYPVTLAPDPKRPRADPMPMEFRANPMPLEP